MTTPRPTPDAPTPSTRSPKEENMNAQRLYGQLPDYITDKVDFETFCQILSRLQPKEGEPRQLDALKSTLGTIPCPQEQTQDLEEKWADPYGKDFVRYSENQLEAAKAEAYQRGEAAMAEKAGQAIRKWNFMSCSDADGLEAEIRSLAGAVPYDANQKEWLEQNGIVEPAVQPPQDKEPGT
jgi:hypothetical protein